MLGILRRIGIALGSLVAAYLAVALVGGMLGFGPVLQHGLGLLVAVVLGGLVYRDILRRELPRI